MIKRIQLIYRTLLMQSKLPVSALEHAMLHASMLIRLRPMAYHQYSPAQRISGHQIFLTCANLVTQFKSQYHPPPKRTKMRSQRKFGIYVGYDSHSIIRYLEPMAGDVFTTHFFRLSIR